MGKTIITCAVTGGIHAPTMSDAPLLTPDASKLTHAVVDAAAVMEDQPCV